MTMKTCAFCGEKYTDSFRNWYNKYCCNSCFVKSKSGYIIGDVVYTNDNTKDMSDLSLHAVSAKGVISAVYKLYNPTKNGIYQFVVNLDSGKNVRRFAHQIFRDELSCKQFVDTTNKRRDILREAKKLLKNL